MADDGDPGAAAVPAAPPVEAPLAAVPGEQAVLAGRPADPDQVRLPQAGAEGEGRGSEMTGPSRSAFMGGGRPGIPLGRGNYGAPSGSATDTVTQFHGSGQASALVTIAPQEHSSPPGAGDKRDREDQQDASSPGKKRHKVGPWPDGHETGQSSALAADSRRMDIMTCQSAPAARGKAVRLADLPGPLLPSFANSCPPGFALAMAAESRGLDEAKEMPALPSTRSLPLRDGGEEAWGEELKPSRTYPLRPKRSTQDDVQEGLDTQLSRRSSNRSWSQTAKANVGGPKYLVYSNQFEEGGLADNLEDPDLMLEDGPMADDSVGIEPLPPSLTPPVQVQVRMDTWEPPVKSQARGGAETWDSHGASKPSSGRRGGRDASSCQTRRGGTPLLGKISTGRSNPRLLQGGAQPLGADGIMPDSRWGGALPIDARLKGHDSCTAQIQERGQGMAGSPHGHSPAPPLVHAGVQQSSNTLRTDAVMDRVPAALGPPPPLGWPMHGGYFAPGPPPAPLPSQGMGGGLQIPREMQPFLTSVITVLDQVGSSGITPQIRNEAEILRTQAVQYLMCSIVQPQPVPLPPPVATPPSVVNQLAGALIPSLLHSLLFRNTAEPVEQQRLPEADSVKGPPPREEEEQQGSKLVRPIALRSFSPNGDPHRVILDLGHLPKGQADNPFARVADDRPPPLSSKPSEAQIPKPKPSAPALTQHHKRRTGSAAAALLGPSRIAADAAVPERDAVETLLAMNEHPGGSVAGTALRSPRDAYPDPETDPDPIFGAHVPRGRRNRGAGSAHTQQHAPPLAGPPSPPQVVAGETDVAGAPPPPPAALLLPSALRPGSAPGLPTIASMPLGCLHVPVHPRSEAISVDPLESRRSAPHSVFRPIMPPVPWLPPATSAPAPIMAQRMASGPRGPSGLQHAHHHVVSGGGGGAGERTQGRLGGGAPPQRQPPMSVQVVGATPGKAMSMPRPTGAISLQEQTSKYNMPQLVSQVSVGGSTHRVYSNHSGVNVARPPTAGWGSSRAPPPANPPTEPASSDSAN